MNISIIITTYNAEAHVVDTLNSIINQTYQNYEVVIVDDGSIDHTIKIIADYISAHGVSTKIHIFPVKHIGRAAALNYGISLANYNWIAIIDADDLWNFNKLALQVQVIEKYNLDFLATQSKIFFKDSDIDIYKTVKLNFTKSELIKISLDKMLNKNLIPHSSILIKKHLINYSVKRKSQLDYEMYLRLLQNGISIYLLDVCLVYHRIHSRQSFEAKKPLRYALRATSLQLKYCFMNLKLFQILFVIMKLGYYIFLPRKTRLTLKQFYNSIAKSNNE